MDPLPPEDGYELWLRYVPIRNESLADTYRAALAQIVMPAESDTLRAARDELTRGLAGMLSTAPIFMDDDQPLREGTLQVGRPQTLNLLAGVGPDEALRQVGDEGYVITSRLIEDKHCISISANTDVGVLYGVFALLRHLQTQQPLDDLHIVSAPKTKRRMLNHWDNLDGTIERGYAGFSLWDWHKLPHYIAPRYTDYARAMASIGLNGTCLTNVNANALILTPKYLRKVAVLADVLRPYGITTYLTARFSAPMEIGGLKTADPLDPAVRQWWQAKAAQVYEHILDFGGFVVKANSEGQPGPHDYGRTHADGANMLAGAVAPHGGVVIWRAFVYDPDVPDDRHKQANDQLVPLDGTFRDNVLLQVKNGAIDYQPREPFHPLFGAMPQTPLMLELQITQEYLGCATHLAYLATMWKETLDSDTFCRGEGSTVAKVVDGSLDRHSESGMAGVSNIGSDRNWCGHPFGAANWYGFGRLAWDHHLTAEAIAEEWLRMTFSNDAAFVEAATAIMMNSREAVVNYMTPLGLHHIMARGHHYGPGPWVEGGRADWTSVYYHRADSEGVGFDRSPSGSDAVSQYHSPYRERVGSIETCPEQLLLWFHHVPWDHTMQSGRTLWDELCYRYNLGVEQVRQMQQTWESIAQHVDLARAEHVRALLRIQEQEARWWRDACLLYFQAFSGMPIPDEYEQPEYSLDHYRNRTHYYVPGIPELRSHYIPSSMA